MQTFQNFRRVGAVGDRVEHDVRVVTVRRHLAAKLRPVG